MIPKLETLLKNITTLKDVEQSLKQLEQFEEVLEQLQNEYQRTKNKYGMFQLLGYKNRFKTIKSRIENSDATGFYD